MQFFQYWLRYGLFCSLNVAIASFFLLQFIESVEFVVSLVYPCSISQCLYCRSGQGQTHLCLVSGSFYIQANTIINTYFTLINIVNT